MYLKHSPKFEGREGAQNPRLVLVLARGLFAVWCLLLARAPLSFELAAYQNGLQYKQRQHKKSRFFSIPLSLHTCILSVLTNGKKLCFSD